MRSLTKEETFRKKKLTQARYIKGHGQNTKIKGFFKGR